MSKSLHELEQELDYLYNQLDNENNPEVRHDIEIAILDVELEINLESEYV